MPAGWKRGLRFALVALLGLGFAMAGSAHAADDGFKSSVPFWKHSMKWWMQHTYWRLGASELVYAGSSTEVFLEDTPQCRGTTSLALPCGQFLSDTGSGVSSHEQLASMTLGFILPFGGGHFSQEILLAAPLKLKFETRGRLENQSIAAFALKNQSGDPLPTDVAPVGRVVGDIHALPPNFTLVYKPFLHSIIQPYIGVGAYWMFTYSFNVTSPALKDPQHGIQEPHLSLSRPVGCIGQAGFDVKLPQGFFFRADARYLGCATIHATLSNVEQYSQSLNSQGRGVIHAGTLTVDDHLRTWLFSVSLGTTFWGG